MVGRAYTLKEMKVIVDYLKEHRAYKEIRGRKMWMDLADSKLVDRTWQSLKETFLKRILPDIHNPYYKLTIEQISSFRLEYDVEAKINNRLEIVTVSEDSSSTSDYQKTTEKTNMKEDNNTDHQKTTEKTNMKEDNNTGESKSTKIDSLSRSSTETLVLETCNDNAEDAQKVQESFNLDEDKAPKSLRDLITYSEPLTPMLQEVIDDFVTDDEEPRLQIVESEDIIKTEADDQRQSKSPSTLRESVGFNKNEITNVTEKNAIEKSKIKSLKLKKTQKGTWENKESIEEVPSAEGTETNNNESENVFTGNIVSPKPDNKSEKEKNQSGDKNGSMHISYTNDTASLPNNQEELANKSDEKRTSVESCASEFLEPHMKSKKEKTRKRSRSQSSTDRKKKTKSTSRDSSATHEQNKDTQTFDSHPQATDLQKAIGDSNDNIKEQTSTKNSLAGNDEKIASKANEGTTQEAGPSGLNKVKEADFNPCLKSVSLFAEQYAKSKYSDSESDVPAHNNTKEANKTIQDNLIDSKAISNDAKQTNLSDSNTKQSTSNISSDKTSQREKTDIDNIILLKSHSETESGSNQRPKKKITGGPVSKSREKVLANVFGFSSGGAPLKRPKNHRSESHRHSHRYKRHSRNIGNTIESGSSDEYTTPSHSEEDSPRSHSRFDRKYVHPPSYDILSQPGGGGLFVVGRKKVYPIILRENVALHYAYADGNPIDEENDSYWKSKYMEERKKCAEEKIRADELARMFKRATQGEIENGSVSPILQNVPPVSGKSIQCKDKQQKEQVNADKDHNIEETVKITFTKNQEIELEGQWPHVNPVLEKMVAMFKGNQTNEGAKQTGLNSPEIPKTAPIKNAKSQDEVKENKVAKIAVKTGKSDTEVSRNVKANANTKEKVAKKTANTGIEPEQVEISSERSSPAITAAIDPEVHEKVNKIESEIFRQIEEIDKTDQSIIEPTNDTNVNKRNRGRPKNSSSSSITSERSPKNANTKKKQDTEKSTVGEIEIEKNQDSDKLDVPAIESDAAGVSSKRPTRAPKRYESDSGLALPKLKKSESNRSLNKIIPKESVLSPEDDPNVRYRFPPSVRTRNFNRNAKKNSKSYDLRSQVRTTSPDSPSRFSESTQGYRDSDVSPPKVNHNRKRKTSAHGQLKKVKRKSSPSPYLADEDTCETNDSDTKSVAPNASENSEVYRSESYQLLVPKLKTFSQLDKIDETPTQIETIKKFDALTPLTIDINNEYYIPLHERRHDVSKKGSEGNSSSVSLPLSPELSVVENLSISKDTIDNSFENQPTLNELQANNVREPVLDLNRYLINDVDVSLPLMEQNCGLQNNKVRSSRGKSTVSKTFLSQVRAVDIEEQSLSDSLDRKLRDMLLESAKKMSQTQLDKAVNSDNLMEIDTIEPNDKKVKPSKRCSTPRKKKSMSDAKTVEPVLKEHTESCSVGGRKICQPVINVIPCEDAPGNQDIDTSNETVNVQKRGRRIKDVIKVKILKPRAKSGSRDRVHSSKLSVCTDSGINDTSALSYECNICNAVTELIHNHSDTCLHMDECVCNSVEIIESNKSIISLNSNSNCDIQMDAFIESSGEFFTPEWHCTNAQDATNLNDDKSSTQTLSYDTATVYHTPPANDSFNSLLTEDLSNDVPTRNPSKWYLLSEQETNYDAPCSQSSNSGSGGSNLKQIFPVICTVPNLSTISEISKENEGLKPASSNYDKKTNFHSIFNP